MWLLSMLEKTAKSRKIWPNSNKYRKRIFKMKEDLLTSGAFIWIHQDFFLIPEALLSRKFFVARKKEWVTVPAISQCGSTAKILTTSFSE